MTTMVTMVFDWEDRLDRVTEGHNGHCYGVVGACAERALETKGFVAERDGGRLMGEVRFSFIFLALCRYVRSTENA